MSLEAASVFSALLAIDHEGDFCQDMSEAAPLLIAHLSGGMGTATAEQCAWILGEDCAKEDEPKFNCIVDLVHERQLSKLRNSYSPCYTSTPIIPLALHSKSIDSLK